ncbi:MAG: [protein-PII] uridylyltransferase [Gammaproteobacteria bacterium]
MSSPPMMPDFAGLCDIPALDADLAAGADSLPVLQAALKAGSSKLRDWFEKGENAEQIVFGRTWLVDHLLDRIWQRIMGESGEACAMVATGGYGRGELHPYSDIDFLILLPEAKEDYSQGRIEALLTMLWDMGLEVAHSVRTVQQCIDEANKNLTVITNLMENRWISGSRELFDEMRLRIGPDAIWPSDDFFSAKLNEQTARHHKFHDTAYKLEPNIKESPGGMRDIHTVGWVTMRHFGTDSLEELVERGFLTNPEYKTLISGRSFLWNIRNTLHFLTGRREDRLLFDYQLTIARQFGYVEEQPNKAVEHLMKDYYQTVMVLNRLNKMLLQLFQEAILYAERPTAVVPINPRFQASNDFLEVTDDAVFEHSPVALLELFLVLEQHPELKGVRATTIRLVRNNLHLIDAEFRQDPNSRKLFMEILRRKQGVTNALREMNQYGVLAAYLPVFGKIVGQMQHDLIHVYSVDEHTLVLVRNIRRFTVAEFAEEFPLCSKLIKLVPKPEVLYIAGLFHDIAKGRGGNHSELGAVDAQEFCLQHGLIEYDTHLVTWLVRNHLVMSITAQRRDVNDPDVAEDFARTVGSMERLNALYLLTVADIRATNPELWNSWKDALLITLYNETKHALHRERDAPLDKEQRIKDKKGSAHKELLAKGLDKNAIEALWNNFSDEYFLRCIPDEIVWHTQTIASQPQLPETLVDIRQDPSRGSTSLLVYSRAEEASPFATTTAVLDQMGLTIVDARVISFNNGYSLYSYLMLDESGEPIQNQYRVEEIRSALELALQDPRAPVRITRRQPRQFKHFPISTQVIFSEDKPNRQTIVELITADRPGLLSQVARALSDCNITLHNAKIGTFGSRVEDVFYVTDKDNQPLRDPKQMDCLRDTLMQNLDG